MHKKLLDLSQFDRLITEYLAVRLLRACYGATAKGIVFDSVADALRVPNSDIRLFGKPKSNARRRMGVALAFDVDVDVARVNAKRAAGMVRPRAA